MALNRRPAYIKREVKSFTGLFRETDHPRQVIVNGGLVRDESGFGKTGSKIHLQFVAAGADPHGADAFDAARDKRLARNTFAHPIGEGIDWRISTRSFDGRLRGNSANHEVHSFILMNEIADGLLD
jgi:hypothetical protein